MFSFGMQATLLQCLDALCQYSEQVVVHHKAVTAHLLPALAAAVGRPGESRDSRFLCLKLLCDVILHFLLETELYSAPQQSQPAGPGQSFFPPAAEGMGAGRGVGGYEIAPQPSQPAGRGQSFFPPLQQEGWGGV